MKKLTKITASAIIMIGFSLNTFAQASATATAAATIITPIAISKTVDMNFGTAAVQTGTGGTVVLSTAGGRTTGGAGGVTLPNVTGTVAAASFNVTGEGTSTYAITLPVTVTLNSGGNSMTATTFTSNPSITGALTAGAQTLLVGATLNVSAAQAAGSYLSITPFTVTVNYN